MAGTEVNSAPSLQVPPADAATPSQQDIEEAEKLKNKANEYFKRKFLTFSIRWQYRSTGDWNSNITSILQI